MDRKKYKLKCKSSKATTGRGLLFCHFINLSIVVGQVNGHEGKKREPCEVDRQKYLQMRAISWIEKKYILKCKSSEATKGRGLLFCHFINLSAARHHVYLQGPQMLGQQRADPPLGDGRLVGPEPRGHVPDPVFLLRG